MATLTVTELLERNTKYSQNSYQPRPLFSEFPSLGVPPPTTILVTCADPRICPEEFFGLQPGEVIVYRTAGGRVRSILKEILTLDSFLGHGQLNQLLIVHHTDCGASHFTNDGIKSDIISRHPNRKAEVEQWDVGAFEHRSIAESVKDDMEVVLKEEMVSDNLKGGMRGFVLDIKTGKVSEV